MQSVIKQTTWLFLRNLILSLTRKREGNYLDASSSGRLIEPISLLEVHINRLLLRRDYVVDAKQEQDIFKTCNFEAITYMFGIPKVIDETICVLVDRKKVAL